MKRERACECGDRVCGRETRWGEEVMSRARLSKTQEEEKKNIDMDKGKTLLLYCLL